MRRALLGLGLVVAGEAAVTAVVARQVGWWEQEGEQGERTLNRNCRVTPTFFALAAPAKLAA